MKMPGRKTQWADKDKGMRRFRKKQQLRAENREWEKETPACYESCPVWLCTCSLVEEDLD